MLTRQQITDSNQNVLRLRLIERVKMQEMVLLSSRWVGRMVQCYNDDCAEHSIWDGISMGRSVIRAAFPRLEILLLESPNPHSGGRNWGSWWREERWLHHHGGYDHSWGGFFYNWSSSLLQLPSLMFNVGQCQGNPVQSVQLYAVQRRWTLSWSTLQYVWQQKMYNFAVVLNCSKKMKNVPTNVCLLKTHTHILVLGHGLQDGKYF